jgi:hypothetical protein
MAQQKAEYLVAGGSTLETLIEDVNGYLQQGFSPVGSMVIEEHGPESAKTGSKVWYWQPMLRPATWEDDK